MPKKTTRRGRGEGGVHFREDRQLWEGSVSLGYRVTPEGARRRRRERVFAATKQQCLDKMAAVRARARGGAPPDAGKVTVAQLLDRWLDAARRRLAASTCATLAAAAAHLRPRLGHVALGCLSPLHVEDLHRDLAEAGVRPAACRQAATALRMALRYAVRLRLIGSSPAQDVPLPAAPRRQAPFLTAAQAQALLAAARASPCYALLAAALGSGCRQGELLALYWDAVDLDQGVLHVRGALSAQRGSPPRVKAPKTQASRRSVALPVFAADALLEHRKAQLQRGLIAAPVFCTSSGGFLSRRNVLRSLKAAVARANDPDPPRKGGRPGKGAKPPPRRKEVVVPEGLRFHSLRHSVASILLSAGESVRAVAALLGHADAAVTLRVYSHCMPTDGAKLAGTLGRLVG